MTTTPTPMLLIDEALTILWCNDEVSLRLSYSTVALVGKKLSFIIQQMSPINPRAPRQPSPELVRVKTAHSIPKIFALQLTPLRHEDCFRWMVTLHEPSLISDMSLLVSRLLYHDLGNALQLLNAVETRRSTAMKLLGVEEQSASSSCGSEEAAAGAQESKASTPDGVGELCAMGPLREAKGILTDMRVNIPEILECSTNRRFNMLPHDGDVVSLLCAALKQASEMTPGFDFVLELDESISEHGTHFPVTASSFSRALLGVCYFVSYHAIRATPRAVFRAKILRDDWLAVLVSFEAREDSESMAAIPDYFASSGNLRQLTSTDPGDSSFSNDDVRAAMREAKRPETWKKAKTLSFKMAGDVIPMRQPDMQIGIARVLLRKGCLGDIDITSDGLTSYLAILVCPKISSQLL